MGNTVMVDCDRRATFQDSSWETALHYQLGVLAIELRNSELFLGGNKLGLVSLQDTDLQEILARRISPNANVLDHLLESQNLIPESWQSFGAIVFPGTIDASRETGLKRVRGMTVAPGSIEKIGEWSFCTQHLGANMRKAAAVVFV